MGDFSDKDDCVTHHYACDCREAAFTVLKAENERLVGRLQAVHRLERKET